MKLLLTHILFFIAVSSFAQVSPELTESINKLLADKKHKEALKLINKAIDKEPKNADLYSARANVNYNMGEVKKCFADFEKAMIYRPEDPALYHERGLAYFYLQMPEEAMSDFVDGLKFIKEGQDSMKLLLLNNRGNAKNMMRDFKGAYDDFKLVLTYDSLHILALTNIAMVCHEVWKGDEAIGYLLTVIAIDPKLTAAYVNLGFKYLMMEKYPEAVNMFNHALELDPDEPLAYSNRSYAKMMLGDHKGAMQDINKSIEMLPSNSYAYRNRALLMIELGQIEQACYDLQTAIAYGFTDRYGKEVEQLKRQHCGQ